MKFNTILYMIRNKVTGYWLKRGFKERPQWWTPHLWEGTMREKNTRYNWAKAKFGEENVEYVPIMVSMITQQYFRKFLVYNTDTGLYLTRPPNRKLRRYWTDDVDKAHFFKTEKMAHSVMRRYHNWDRSPPDIKNSNYILRQMFISIDDVPEHGERQV